MKVEIDQEGTKLNLEPETQQEALSVYAWYKRFEEGADCDVGIRMLTSFVTKEMMEGMQH
jgi:hypothetical protein